MLFASRFQQVASHASDVIDSQVITKLKEAKKDEFRIQ